MLFILPSQTALFLVAAKTLSQKEEAVYKNKMYRKSCEIVFREFFYTMRATFKIHPL